MYLLKQLILFCISLIIMTAFTKAAQAQPIVSPFVEQLNRLHYVYAAQDCMERKRPSRSASTDVCDRLTSRIEDLMARIERQTTADLIAAQSALSEEERLDRELHRIRQKIDELQVRLEQAIVDGETRTAVRLTRRLSRAEKALSRLLPES